MKKIKLTEATLTRIVERVIKEQEKEVENKKLQDTLEQLKKDPDNQELKDLVAELIKKLGLPVTPKGKQELKV
jgi:predicted metal-dependent hydrolase|tara:strand:+ start:308 stop:526 length:219 start_codon:yes stop_codon:yes gene_type:complete